MRVTTAQLPGPESSDDRILVGPDVVIMLDGASAFAPTGVSAQTYVDRLGPALFDRLVGLPDVGLVDALAAALDETASVLHLTAGAAPSSAVAIARERAHAVEVLVLGDTQVAAPNCIIRDDRLSKVARREREAYQQRLIQGRGFDARHQSLLGRLQTEQRRLRNRDSGYWIAEADPAAAHHALVQTFGHPTPWLVLATDGAYNPLRELGMDDWAGLPGRSQDQLGDLLRRCEEWESEVDPEGATLPRAKRHDDKSLAVVQFDTFARQSCVLPRR